MKLWWKLHFAGAALLSATLFVACGRNDGCVSDGECAGAETRFALHFDNGAQARVRLAITDDERSRGLMGCGNLPADEGMLFVYPISETRAFWMKNVPINLDIGFFDPAGRLLEVRTMYANNRNIVYSVSDDVLYCLEMNEGWFAENGVLPENDSALNCEDLSTALRSRVRCP